MSSLPLPSATRPFGAPAAGAGGFAAEKRCAEVYTGNVTLFARLEDILACEIVGGDSLRRYRQ
jgi:hypothetical protein